MARITATKYIPVPPCHFPVLAPTFGQRMKLVRRYCEMCRAEIGSRAPRRAVSWAETGGRVREIHRAERVRARGGLGSIRAGGAVPSGPTKKKPRSRRGLAVWRVQEDIEHAISVRPFYDGLRAAQWRGERSLDLLKQSADAVATSREGHRSRRSGRAGQHRRWGRGPGLGGWGAPGPR